MVRDITFVRMHKLTILFHFESTPRGSLKREDNSAVCLVYMLTTHRIKTAQRETNHLVWFLISGRYPD